MTLNEIANYIGIDCKSNKEIVEITETNKEKTAQSEKN